MVFDPEARTRRRDGLTMVCLAVCAYCFGFGVTDWACDLGEEAAVPAHSVVLQHKRTADPTGARAEMRAPEPIVQEPTRVAESARRVTVVAPANTSPSVQKRTKRAPVEPRSERIAPEIAASDEPTPMVSVEELNQALALADASTRILASVDETSPKPVVVVPPPAAAVPAEDAPATAKVVAIEGLSVDGALPSKVVNRGVQRLLPQYDRCREYSDSATQRLKLSTTIDEAGHGRRVTVEGLSGPGLRRCLEQATAHLVVPAPDTGTARAQWFVRFAAR